MRRTAFLAGAAAALLSACTSVEQRIPLIPDEPKVCTYCEAWNQPLEPYQIVANTWYVGTAGLASILITSDTGHVLIDGGLPQSAPVIEASIERLGFRLGDVALILSSHAHFDHVGGLAALVRASGARVAASRASALALASGTWAEGDPQAGFGPTAGSFPPVTVDQIVDNGAVLEVGELRITAHLTPGHTAGGTTWAWESCDATRCYDVVYADSINPVSAPDFRYSRSRNPAVAFGAVQESIDRVAGLSCDVLLSPHPFYFEMKEKLSARTDASAFNPFVDDRGCRTYAEKTQERLDQRRTAEAGGP
ncbi:MAG: subclass B3 metallo-beta-lactamase [Pseudomonadota bacterium]